MGSQRAGHDWAVKHTAQHGHFRCVQWLSRVWLCKPMDYSPPGSTVHGTLQARILEWVAILFSRGSSWPRDWTRISCTIGGFFTIRATRERTNNERENKSIIITCMICERLELQSSLVALVLLNIGLRINVCQNISKKTYCTDSLDVNEICIHEKHLSYKS